MKEKINFYLPFFILFCSFISLFLISLSYTSIIISSLCIVFSIIFFRKRIRLFIFTIFISIATIITSSIIIYKEKEVLIDKYNGTNIVLGTWLYNKYGGTYVFNDDYTYIQYMNEKTNDNYCIGNYNYSYGGISNEGKIIREDNNFYYYNLNLIEDYCIISEKENYLKKENKMIFAIGKNNDDILLIDKDTENMFVLNKIK